MNKRLNAVAAAAIAAGLATGATPASAQQVLTVDEVIDSFKDRVPAEAEFIISQSDAAIPADNRLMVVATPELNRTYTTCVDNVSLAIENVVGVSMTDLIQIAVKNGGALDFDTTPLLEAFKTAGDATIFEAAPENPSPRYSAQGEQQDYHFRKMANDFEAAHNITVTTVTAIYKDPNSSCGMHRMDEMPEDIKNLLPPEVLQQLGIPKP